MNLPSTEDLKRLFSSGSWALGIVWSTHRSLTSGLALAALARGLVPAGLAIFARGLINVFVDEGLDASTRMDALLPWFFFGFGVTLTEAVSPLAHRFCAERLQDELNIRMTADILRHAEKLDLAFFENPEKRNLLDRAQQYPAQPFMRFVTEIQNSATCLLQTISLVALLAIIEPLVLVALAPFVLPYLLFHLRLSKRRYQEEYRRTPQRRWTSYFVSLLTGRHSVAEIKLLDLGPCLREKFSSLMKLFRDRDRKLHRRNVLGSGLFALILTITFFAVFFRVIRKVIDGVLTVGDVAVFGGATARLRFSLEGSIRSLSSALEQTFFISNLIAFFNEQPQMVSGSKAPAAPGAAAIALQDVSFTYPGAAKPALRDISLEILPGETIALVGENGAGKTTLVKLLARLYDPDSGSVRLDGTDLRTFSLKDLHRQIGFVFQDFVRYEATLADNIAYGDWQALSADRQKIEEVGHAAGLDALVRSLPAGYDTRLGRIFGQTDLSGGQWQNLAIARALARSASILILDEPTASLSAGAEYELFRRFHELSQGRTTILVSHRFSTLSIADRIFVMEQGRIVEAGTHQELLARNGHYARLYRLHRNPLEAVTPRESSDTISQLK